MIAVALCYLFQLTCTMHTTHIVPVYRVAVIRSSPNIPGQTQNRSTYFSSIAFCARETLEMNVFFSIHVTICIAVLWSFSPPPLCPLISSYAFSASSIMLSSILCLFLRNFSHFHEELFCRPSPALWRQTKSERIEMGKSKWQKKEEEEAKNEMNRPEMWLHLKMRTPKSAQIVYNFVVYAAGRYEVEK